MLVLRRSVNDRLSLNVKQNSMLSRRWHLLVSLGQIRMSSAIVANTRAIAS